jgi:hypothetical protein
MKFHLNHTPDRAGFDIEHGHRIFLTGSCFAAEIGALLGEHRFRVMTNPDGVLFNPVSICNSLDYALHIRPFNSSLLVEREGVCCSYLHHSSVQAKTPDELLRKIRTTAERTQEFLWSANFLVITFGSAFIYYHKELDQVVANCHKQPSSLFEKQLLSAGAIVRLYDKLITALRNVNPGIKIIFTVSPVKHLADGVVGNTLSKSTLLLSVHDIIRRHPDCHYFPAYELVTDDLRDYRFYKEDLAHPNELAVRYVWDKFSSCYFTDETLELNRQIERLTQAMKHRQMNEGGDQAKLQEYIRRQKETLMRLNPALDI